MQPVVPVRLVLASIVFAVFAASALPALASFPGTNGRIAIGTSGGGQTPGSIYTMAADGTDLQPLVTNPPRRAEPAWSPDGTKVAYRRGVPNSPPNLAVVNADGTDDHVLLPDATGEASPSWSPDGTKIAFTRNNNAGLVGTLWVVDAAGGPPTQLTTTAQGNTFGATWSPDGTKIAFSRDADIWMMNADGTNQVNLTNTAEEYEIEPDWSPDGSRIVFRWTAGSDETLQIQIRVLDVASETQSVLVDDPPRGVAPDWSPDGTKVLYLEPQDEFALSVSLVVVSADGTGHAVIFPSGSYVYPDSNPDWQPIPVTSYPRPKGATPTQVSMVPAYAQCTSPNRTHGPPLAFPSCASPTQTSNQLTVGTADSNGKPTKSRGTVRYDAIAGAPATPADEADVQVTVELFDIYELGSLADYSGDLTVRVGLRITDKLNTPHPGGPGAATVTDVALDAPVPCAATADTTEGGSCNLVTTFDALAPGMVTESKRSIWALGVAQLYDANDDLFMTQGLFIP